MCYHKMSMACNESGISGFYSESTLKCCMGGPSRSHQANSDGVTLSPVELMMIRLPSKLILHGKIPV